MKKLIWITALLLAVVSCKKDPQPEPIKPANDYTGTVRVTYNGEDYDNEDILVNVTDGEAPGTFDILINKIRFVPSMPVTVDVTLPAIPYEKVAGDEYTFAATDFDPYAMGGPFPKYHVTNLSGKIKGENLTFDLLFGTYPTHFSGSVSL